jgi:predicted Zn-dependent protease with MMP-like domain
MRIVLAFLLAFSFACGDEVLSPGQNQDIEILLRVTGGFAGADYSVIFQASTGRLLGESCANLCDFQAGQVISQLSQAQVSYILGLFEAADIGSRAGTDFGIECCDQFHYEVVYFDGVTSSHVQGSSERLPQSLREAVGTLQGMASGVMPVVVDFESPADGWPRDPLQIRAAAVQGGALEIGVDYGGGCRTHNLQAVAWGGWMESDPVRVRLLLAHEDFDDPCDALIHRDLRFDLSSLQAAYREAYGTESPGETTVVLLLEDPMMAGPLSARVLDYVF